MKRLIKSKGLLQGTNSIDHSHNWRIHVEDRSGTASHLPRSTSLKTRHNHELRWDCVGFQRTSLTVYTHKILQTHLLFYI